MTASAEPLLTATERQAASALEEERVPQQHLLGVVVEDFFQVAPCRDDSPRSQWYRFETRVERNTARALNLLDEFGIRATFFVVGWIADQMPELVYEIAQRGHEIASKGYYHRNIRQMSPSEFREDLARSREALERASGTMVLGYRIAHGWFGPLDLWALDALTQEGFLYDSSIRPHFRSSHEDAWRRFPHLHRRGGRTLWEFPLSTWSLGGWSFPISGGNYLRQFPHAMMKGAVDQWQRTTDEPFLMYFHVWELDPDQPRIAAAPPLQKVRQYANLERMSGIIRYYLEKYRFTGIAQHLIQSHPQSIDRWISDPPGSGTQAEGTLQGGTALPHEPQPAGLLARSKLKVLGAIVGHLRLLTRPALEGSKKSEARSEALGMEWAPPITAVRFGTEE